MNMPLYRFPPALAAAALIRDGGLNPFLLVHPNCLPDLPQPADDKEFDSVVLGDAVDGFSYANINKAFQVLNKTQGPFFSLGKGMRCMQPSMKAF